MMYEFRANTLQKAVSLAVQSRCQSFATKKIEKAHTTFSFAEKARSGPVLLVGEGNLSFALALAQHRLIPASSITATVFEAEGDLSKTAYENARLLLRLGTKVQANVDATQLAQSVKQRRFELIIFQFPNVASRDPLYGQNPNHILATRFLKSARSHLRRNDVVAITTVDNPHYEGVFRLTDAAQKAGFPPPSIYTFRPDDFPGYQHVNTADEESALNGHRKFATFVFTP